MKQHLNEPLRAATLAGVANMSLPHYFALFKRVVGSSPIDYLIKLRMERARRLLAETSWSVKEVAVSLGYDDPLYFSRVFKSINQTAPSDFRARRRNINRG
jgi:iron complex transport system substrate-binding protein